MNGIIKSPNEDRIWDLINITEERYNELFNALHSEAKRLNDTEGGYSLNELTEFVDKTAQNTREVFLLSMFVGSKITQDQIFASMSGVNPNE